MQTLMCFDEEEDKMIVADDAQFKQVLKLFD